MTFYNLIKSMIIAIITIGLIMGTAYLVRNAKIKNSIESYILVLLGSIITLLFEPIIIVFFTDGSVDGGAIQIASTFTGIYFIGWSIIRIVKNKKNNIQSFQPSNFKKTYGELATHEKHLKKERTIQSPDLLNEKIRMSELLLGIQYPNFKKIYNQIVESNIDVDYLKDDVDFNKIDFDELFGEIAMFKDLRSGELDDSDFAEKNIDTRLFVMFNNIKKEHRNNLKNEILKRHKNNKHFNTDKNITKK